jgi:DNA-binding response OmpR family regulator
MSDNQEGVVVLVVEDEWTVLEILRLELEDAGWQVLTAKTGETALATMRETPIDLLVTDIRLAGKTTGWEVAVLARRTRPAMPVIYATGSPSDDVLRVSESAFFAKPYNPADIVTKGRQLLASNRPAPLH